MTADPRGALREVAAGDLFFSTTDRSGRIDGSNAVFCHYAHYEMAELIGAPHNIIRHPGMPGGVFHIMWDLLLSGRPMAGYVANLASDGVTYWVFATITPLGDGFLSVRQRPCRTDLAAAAAALYEKVRPVEVEARDSGASRADAARIGAGLLAEGIGALGLSDYQDFIRLAVPAEVAARRAVTSWTEPDPRDLGTGVTQDLVDAAVAVDRALDSQMVGLDELESLSSRLAEASEQLAEAMVRLRAAVSAAAVASQEVADSEPVLAKVVNPLTETSQWLADRFTQLALGIGAVQDRIAELRLRNALARLHDEALAEFAREMAADEAPERAPIYVRQLCVALEETATTASQETLATQVSLRDLAQDLLEAEVHLGEFQRLLATWRLLIPRYRLSQRLGPYTGPIDQQLLQGLRQVSEARQLADRCLVGARLIDPAPLSRTVADVVRAREAVLG